MAGMRPDATVDRRSTFAHLGAYAMALAALVVLSWLGSGWGYAVLYGIVLLAFGLCVAVVALGLAWGARSRGTLRARAFAERSVRSFSRAQITLGVALVATSLLARLGSGPLGPFPGGPFEGSPSEQPFEAGLLIERDEIQIQIPTDAPYTITTHAFWIAGVLYVGADFVFPFKRWVHVVQEEPEVVLRVGGRLFRRHAHRIDDPEESRRLLEEVSRQRGVHPDDWLTDVWFFRMDPPS